MKKPKILLVLLSTILLTGCVGSTISSVVEGGDINPFDYTGNFENPELNIDGKKLESEWSSEYATAPINFSYKNFLNKNTYNVELTLYRGKSELYAFFHVEDCNILSDGYENGNAVSNGDSVEIYLDTRNDGGAKPQNDDYQINLGVNGKARILVGNGSGWSSWTGLVQYEVEIDGTLNVPDDIDNSYNVEMSIPYKQINISRDQTIGLTAGLVDKYEIGGGATHKRWYGLSIGGAFGSPQIPDDYFDYDKNTLKVPPLPDYVIASDSTPYIATTNMGIGAIEGQENNYSSVSLNVSRSGSIITVRAHANEKWKDNQGICFSFDFGDDSRTKRDSSTLLLRVFPKAKSIRDFFINPTGTTTGISKKELDIKIDEDYCFVSFDYKELKTSSNTPLNITYEGDIGFMASTLDETLHVLAVAKINEKSSDNVNPSTWLRLFANNSAKAGSDKTIYDPESDTTEYIEGIEITVPSNTSSSVVYPTCNVQVSRVENVVTVRVSAPSGFGEDVGVAIYLDIASDEHTLKDQNTVVLRAFPKQNMLKDFFTLGNSKGLSQKGLTVKYDENTLFATFDYSTLTYADNSPVSFTSYNGDIGVNVSTTTATLKVVESLKVNNKSVEANTPSTWLRLFADNSASAGASKNQYIESKDSTVYMDNFPLSIASATGGGVTHPDIAINASRNGNVITIKAQAATAFTEDYGLALFFDFANETHEERDTNTAILRVNPAKTLVKDFFTKGNDEALNQNSLTMLFSEDVFFVSFDYKTLAYVNKTSTTFSDYEGSIAFQMSVVKEEGLVHLSGATSTANVVSQNVPYTWVRLNDNNTFNNGVNLNEYMPASDTTSYLTGFDLNIAELVDGEKTFNAVDIDVARHNNKVTIKAEATSGFHDKQGLAIYVDMGSETKTSRDINSFCLRLRPNERSVVDFFTFPNKALNQAGLTLKYSSTVVFIEFDYSLLNYVDKSATSFASYSGDIGLALATIDLTVGASYKVNPKLSINSKTCDTGNPSTWLRLFDNNTAKSGLDKNVYFPEFDTTSYIEGTTLGIAEIIAGDNTYQQIEVYASRVGSLLTFKCVAQNDLASYHGFAFYIDFASKRSTRDGNTAVIRVKPSESSVTSFFTLTAPDTTRLKMDAISAKFTSKICFISFDYAAIVDQSNNPAAFASYEGDIGFSVGSALNGENVKAHMNINGVATNTGNPMTYLRLTSTNTIGE